MVLTNVHKYIEIILYTQRTLMCFDQLCSHLQYYKIQMLDVLKFYIHNEL